MKKAPQAIVYFYTMTLFFLLPLYHEGSYDNLSQHKIKIFYLISAAGFALFILYSIYSDLREKNTFRRPSLRHRFLQLPPAVLALGLFLLSAIISTARSPYPTHAFYGIPGFGMGLLSITLMVLAAIYIRQNGNFPDIFFHLVVLSSVVPTIIAIFNRCGYDPLDLFPDGVYVQAQLYMSTIGNYGWYFSYMAVIVPIALYMIVTTKLSLLRLLYALYLLLVAVISYLVGTGTFLVAMCAVLILIFLLQKTPILQFLQRYPLAPVVVSILFFFAILLLVAVVSQYPDAMNARGFIWQLSLSLYKNLPLQEKLFGVGPNCYMDALQGFLAEQPLLVADFQTYFGDLSLTTAHNEYFDYLINQGVFGLLSYAGIIVLFFQQLLQKNPSRSQEIASLCVISYLLFVTVNFSIVLSTPYFFIFLGIAFQTPEHEWSSVEHKR